MKEYFPVIFRFFCVLRGPNIVRPEMEGHFSSLWPFKRFRIFMLRPEDGQFSSSSRIEDQAEERKYQVAGVIIFTNLEVELLSWSGQAGQRKLLEDWAPAQITSWNWRSSESYISTSFQCMNISLWNNYLLEKLETLYLNDTQHSILMFIVQTTSASPPVLVEVCCDKFWAEQVQDNPPRNVTRLNTSALGRRWRGTFL